MRYSRKRKPYAKSKKTSDPLIPVALAFLAVLTFLVVWLDQAQQRKGYPPLLIKNKTIQRQKKASPPSFRYRTKNFVSEKAPWEKPPRKKITVEQKPLPEKKAGAKLAIVIDDFGNNWEEEAPFLKSSFPITVSVLPHLPYTEKIWKEAIKNPNIEVILHLPMEPYGYPKVNPGPGAILLRMGVREIINTLEGDLREVPVAKGANNHMGSKATENYDLMLVVMSYLKKKGLFFLDSRTTPNTVADLIAWEISMPFARRDVFIDNEKNKKKIEENIIAAAHIALQKGEAIAIGHARRVTWEALQAAWKKLNQVKFVKLSSLVKIPEAPP